MTKIISVTVAPASVITNHQLQQQKRKALWAIRERAEKDHRLSDGALRLIWNICDHRYRADAPLDAAFPMPWTLVGSWCGIVHRNECYARVRQLVTHAYLLRQGIRGTPPTAWFSLCGPGPAGFKSTENRTLESTENRTLESTENRTNESTGNRTHHISSSLREEMYVHPIGKKFDARSASQESIEEENSSLRSEELTAEKLQEHLDALRRAVDQGGEESVRSAHTDCSL